MGRGRGSTGPSRDSSRGRAEVQGEVEAAAGSEAEVQGEVEAAAGAEAREEVIRMALHTIGRKLRKV